MKFADFMEREAGHILVALVLIGAGVGLTTAGHQEIGLVPFALGVLGRSMGVLNGKKVQ